MPQPDNLANDLGAWITLTRAPLLGVAALTHALEISGSATALVSATDALFSRAGISAPTRAFLRSTAAQVTHVEASWARSPGHYVLPFTDPRFPQSLTKLNDCPIALYVAGNIGILSEPQLAIVGSRNPSPQGQDTAYHFAEFLAKSGLTVTSGLAEGIDTAAHRGALAAGGAPAAQGTVTHGAATQANTIAVVGTGLDTTYPRSNQKLAEEIAARGALVSEFPLATPIQRGNFPRRNRIIAALSLGTLVVEAARQSGSLITARLAGELGKEVFAVPGSIHNPMSRGCHQLIREGAKLTENAADILSELNFSAFLGREGEGGSQTVSPAKSEASMDKDHKILLDALGFDPTDLDALVVRTGLKSDAVSSMMLILELEGHVKAAPGGRYSRVVRSL
jgi:DNA processing protein